MPRCVCYCVHATVCVCETSIRVCATVCVWETSVRVCASECVYRHSGQWLHGLWEQRGWLLAGRGEHSAPLWDTGEGERRTETQRQLADFHNGDITTTATFNRDWRHRLCATEGRQRQWLFPCHGAHGHSPLSIVWPHPLPLDWPLLIMEIGWQADWLWLQ